MNVEKIREVLGKARAAGRGVLLETEGMEVLKAMGFRVPETALLAKSDDALNLDLSRFPGDKVVIKAVSNEILHKTDVRAVDVVAKDTGSIYAAIATMEFRLKHLYQIHGFSVNQFVPHEKTLGGELLLGMRWTEDFGPVVSFGPGGIFAEYLSSQLKEGREVAIFTPESFPLSDTTRLERAIARTAVHDMVCGSLRGQAPGAQVAMLRAVVEKFLAFAAEFVPGEIRELEVNPFALTGDGLVALDCLAKLGPGIAAQPAQSAAARPLTKINHLLRPRSVALVGVSEKGGPGKVILGNLIHDGFDRAQIFVVKPGATTLDGFPCYPDIGSLPKAVDLCVLAIPAAQVPDTITQAVESRKAESLIVIPGGLEEKSGTEAIVSKMKAALEKARASDWRGPVINGGNCLGVLSRPGKYSTLFIPEHKLPLSGGKQWPLALISQSGAFAISRLNKISGMNPRYVVTLGNQMDLTVGDYLEHLKDDPEVKVFAVYVEGFRPLDGAKFIRVARQIVESGRKVILYRAGRTSAGVQASASHTASIAGDFVVTRELSRSAGVMVAGSIEQFEDLTRVFSLLGDRKPTGHRLGVVSNAGFECVAAADSLGSLELAAFSPELTAGVQELLVRAKIDQLVDVHNPMDLTPMCGDADFEAVVARLLLSDGVDAAIVGCVPLTPALQTLAPGSAHQENAASEAALASRLGLLATRVSKPWIMVVDAGSIYDPFVQRLESAGIPVFRSMDRALKAFRALWFSEELS